MKLLDFAMELGQLQHMYDQLQPRLIMIMTPGLISPSYVDVSRSHAIVLQLLK